MSDVEKVVVVAQPEKVAKKASRMTEEEILKDYPHAKAGTLCFLGAENKQAVQISCTEPGCATTRLVRTSDLWQVKRCESCSRKAKRANAKAKRATKKAEAAEE